MEKMGTHLVVDPWQAPAELLNSPEAIRQGLIEAVIAGKATLIDLCVHQLQNISKYKIICQLKLEN